jgi:hypothetical protein
MAYTVQTSFYDRTSEREPNAAIIVRRGQTDAASALAACAKVRFVRTSVIDALRCLGPVRERAQSD